MQSFTLCACATKIRDKTGMAMAEAFNQQQYPQHKDLSDKDLTLMAQCHGQKTTGRSLDFWRHTNDSPFENNSQTQEDEQNDTIRTNTSYML